MIENGRVLAIIPARGGSKGIPKKNIINLLGKPLIAYTIDAALHSKYIDYVMVSTDDKEIAEIAKRYGAEIPFMRPAELSTDTSKTIDAIIHAIVSLQEMRMFFSDLILLQPTGPLRTSQDIDGALEMYCKNNRKALASVCEVEDHPILVRTIENNNLKSLLNVLSTCRRQDMPKYYKINGCIYINSIDEIKETTSFNDNKVPYIMEKNHSVDIDDLKDLAIAEYYIRSSSEEL